MIELLNNELRFSFPDIHPDASLTIQFQRTLRIPDDDTDYPLPPGLGRFPLRHVDDFGNNVPPAWLKRGGVMLPMYQSEAMWLNFHGEYVSDHETTYPMAIRIAAGKINAVTGDEWVNHLDQSPQNYMVIPTQPWLDGYCVEKGIIRQFVAMPLGAGYSAEEQLTGEGEWGGLQIAVHPMKRDVFERRFPKIDRQAQDFDDMEFEMDCCFAAPCEMDMGLAPGGRMKQDIYDDPYDFADWDAASQRCFVHLANSLVWRQVTGQNPPPTPATAKEYANAGLPWYDYMDADNKPVKAQSKLKGLKSVTQLAAKKSDAPLPENESVSIPEIISLKRRSPNEVLSGDF